MINDKNSRLVIEVFLFLTDKLGSTPKRTKTEDVVNTDENTAISEFCESDNVKIELNEDEDIDEMEIIKIEVPENCIFDTYPCKRQRMEEMDSGQQSQFHITNSSINEEKLETCSKENIKTPNGSKMAGEYSSTPLMPARYFSLSSSRIMCMKALLYTRCMPRLRAPALTGHKNLKP